MDIVLDSEYRIKGKGKGEGGRGRLRAGARILLLIFSVKGDGRCDGVGEEQEGEGSEEVTGGRSGQIVFNVNKTCLTQDVHLRYMFEVKTNDLRVTKSWWRSEHSED